ncbi:monooxygenase [Mycobacterium lacus]|nr:monooxygenase [Mycobacterium lacus]
MDVDLALASHDVVSSVFDDATDTWVLTTSGGESYRADVVVAAQLSVFVPWIPDLPGVFGGESFHAAAWDPDFDPSGKHVAVIGTDAAVAHHIGRLTESARSVTAFAYPPRRFVTELPLPATRAGRWWRRHARHERPSAVRLTKSAIGVLTSSGIRTSDGVDHRADAIIYGTGFSVPDQVRDETLVGTRGLTIRQAWHDGMEPFLGVAVRGFPNYFFITGPDAGAQARYVAACLNLMSRTASRRIEVRGSSQQVFNERAQLRPVQAPRAAAAFDLSSGAADDDVYDGAATLELAGTRHPVRVRLTGHLDPIDGNYHWQGTIFDPLPQDSVTQGRAATLSVGQRSTPARIVERTPWGTHSVAGVGAPPYARSGR